MMPIAWGIILGLAVGATGWHEVVQHHLISRLLRRQVAPSAHHTAWTGLPSECRLEIRAEMVIGACSLAAVAGLWPLAGLIFSAVATVCAAAWTMFRRDAGAPADGAGPGGHQRPREESGAVR